MNTLIVHNVTDSIVEALQARAATNNTSVEIEHLKILNEILLSPAKRSFANALANIPPVGTDSDFERIQNGSFEGESTHK